MHSALVLGALLATNSCVNLRSVDISINKHGLQSANIYTGTVQECGHGMEKDVAGTWLVDSAVERDHY